MVSTRRAGALSSWQLLLRALAYHRGQSIAVVVLTALITAGAVLAPWYVRMVVDSATARSFAVGEPSTTISLSRAGDPVDGSLDDVVPDDLAALLSDPISGLDTAVEWTSPLWIKPIAGGLVSRDDICERLELVAGTCFGSATSDAVGVVTVAISEADAEMYELEVGDVLPEVASTFPGGAFEVVGIYRPVDADDPYWFGNPPTGRSGVIGPDLNIPVSDLFVVAPGAVTGDDGRGVQYSVDLRVDPDGLTSLDLPVLSDGLAELRTAATEARISVNTGVDDTLDELDRSGRAAATTMVVTAAQVGVLGLIVLAMMVGVVLARRRPELGLARLRGRGGPSLVAGLAAQWAVLVVAGAVAGAGLALGAAALARQWWLPEHPSLAPPVGVVPAWAAAVVVAVVLLVVMARPVVREPVPALLRTTGPRVASASRSSLLLDTVLITAAICGVAVGLQAGEEESALILLAPSLLAVAASVLVVRLLTWVARRLTQRWLARGRPAPALAAVLLARGRGNRLLLAVLCVSAAFLVFSTQLSAVGGANREHRAQVEAGAAAVGATTASPGAVVAALDEIDPDRESATLVVTTSPENADALGGLFVEPEAFTRLAYGALDAAPASAWADVVAPDVRPPTMTGRTLQVTVEPYELDVDEPDTRLELEVDYLHPDGFLTTARLGALPAVSDQPRTLEAPVDCATACDVVRWRLDPDGPVAGDVSLVDIGVTDGVDGAGTVSELDLGPTDTWPRENDAAESTTATTGVGTLTLGGETGGLPFTVQHASLPGVLPVVLARQHPVSAEYAAPTVVSPGGRLLPVRVVATASEAVPRALRNVVVADVAAVVRAGELNASGRTAVQVWYGDGTDAADRRALGEQLAERGVPVRPVDTVADRESLYSGSAEALTSRILPAAGSLAVLLGLLAVLVSVAAGWRSASRDLAALRMAGVGRRALRRAACGLYLVMVVAGIAVGAGCGLAGFALAIGQTPLFAVPEPEIPLDLDPDVLTAVVGLALLVAVLGSTAVAAGRWLVARSTLDRVRDGGA
ncbi:FtsX-like permease family protein [Nocardioides sp. C4-1]|uniref:FtsX-like permease family protein n=1 Tax=Nocardioides sp. C4-1 TaxID=3151851 RepID=UPI003266FFE4